MLYPLRKAFFVVLSRIPFSALYLLSDICAFFLLHIVGYRKKISFDNLTQAFPQKSKSELKKIQKEVYTNFCDVFIETLKLLDISKSQLQKRVRLCENVSIKEIEESIKGGIVVFGHFGNWEWLGSGLALYIPFETKGIYQPLSNSFFDKLMLDIRQRHGNKMVSADNAYRDCLQHISQPSFYGFLLDQNPRREESNFFIPFLGRPAPFTLGTAKIVLKTSCRFFYAEMTRLKRGFYEINLQKIETENKSAEELTALHAAKLEESIQKNPSLWLWTHRRWKHAMGPKDILLNKTLPYS